MAINQNRRTDPAIKTECELCIFEFRPDPNGKTTSKGNGQLEQGDAMRMVQQILHITAWGRETQDILCVASTATQR